MRRTRSNPQPVLKPQDLLVALKLVCISAEKPTYEELARQLGLTASETHAAVGRAALAGLVSKPSGGTPIALRLPLKGFLLHGAGHAFPAAFGPPTRGLPTGYAAPILVERIVQPEELPPVWPDPQGEVRGIALYPLYPSVPEAARRDAGLYDLLALFDAIRAGRARERALAVDLIEERLGSGDA